MRRRLLVPVALLAAGVYVVVRRSRRPEPALHEAGSRRARREALATTWPWPKAPEREVASHEPLFDAPGWDGDVQDPVWTRPPETSSPEPGPEPPIASPVQARSAEPAPPVASEPEQDLAAQPSVDIALEEDAVPAEAEVLDAGPFAFGGWAPQPGATSVMGVTVSRPLDSPPRSARIRLDVRSTRNVPEDGIVVLSGDGFAPDREGFAIMLAADGPGSFRANGRWELLGGEPP